ncbi:hypothetical protein COW36_04870 [bacterium (Candidatus Blackallbacteria) CG17_big_fil_post_rev_8_21_14_2_50_48_46]|uniref:Uncharacterized protein n=1 Tax=bacterium (Candidatus Blackallbacteria) CG17_big_fil_post_rev_8_21_14_2_50_48_46 TaxID=2014261 RepID=A0A2M7G943_9BACT|nr:MAG: hypothetical protein COW64_04075 [bacterium (Candidatus Blackallbacteria) CG18_big_fil_WC_8_21_14_2_50_49_26]PIW18628.1 MAG: hypothetical protein COW36_04870 [bacterium (Candidatus Blackallbacteria) CG17_big_fil_post_rev_8_21_14_2_50_48_46]PIW46386.1 MAG: hypothetical protein COW20_15810 [bacterium (Candidatus Blackallbacteria) CG13_big_fil_rev_8_21_14_2_50_49_14]
MAKLNPATETLSTSSQAAHLQVEQLFVLGHQLLEMGAYSLAREYLQALKIQQPQQGRVESLLEEAIRRESMVHAQAERTCPSFEC